MGQTKTLSAIKRGSGLIQTLCPDKISI